MKLARLIFARHTISEFSRQEESDLQVQSQTLPFSVDSHSRQRNGRHMSNCSHRRRIEYIEFVRKTSPETIGAAIDMRAHNF